MPLQKNWRGRWVKEWKAWPRWEETQEAHPQSSPNTINVRDLIFSLPMQYWVYSRKFSACLLRSQGRLRDCCSHWGHVLEELGDGGVVVCFWGLFPPFQLCGFAFVHALWFHEGFFFFFGCTLGFHCCAQALLSWDELWRVGATLVRRTGGFSLWWLLLLRSTGSI